MNTKALKENPLFHLSLSSKELFHTNFWFWLWEKAPQETVSALFPGVAVQTRPGLVREKKVTGIDPNAPKKKVSATVDLALYDGPLQKEKKPLAIIENKVKDFISDQQQWKIWVSVRDTSADSNRFLYSVFPAKGISFLRDWKVLNYKDLADSLHEKVLPVLSGFDQGITQKYIELCNDLHELAESIPQNDTYDLFGSQSIELFEELNEIRMWEAWLKNKGAIMAQYIGAILRKRFPTLHIHTHTSVNRKKPTIDFWICFEDGYAVGIQIESHQYRRIIFSDKTTVAVNSAKTLMDQKVWFVSDGVYTMLYKYRPDRGREDFAGYKNHFRYIWRAIPEQTSFDQLTSEIEVDFNYILSHKRIFEQVLGKRMLQI